MKALKMGEVLTKFPTIVPKLYSLNGGVPSRSLTSRHYIHQASSLRRPTSTPKSAYCHPKPHHGPDCCFAETCRRLCGLRGLARATCEGAPYVALLVFPRFLPPLPPMLAFLVLPLALLSPSSRSQSTRSPVLTFFSASFKTAAPATVRAALALLLQHDVAGFTPLHHAVAANDTQFATQLLAVLANVDAPCSKVDCRDVKGLTPLHWAVRRGFGALVKLLIESGASPNAQDRSGKNGIHHAVEAMIEHGPTKASFYHDMIRYLMQSGGNVDAADEAGVTPLHMAAECGDSGLVRLSTLLLPLLIHLG